MSSYKDSIPRSGHAWIVGEGNESMTTCLYIMLSTLYFL